ncbi:MAG: 3-deoxy-manno-octulosonate cytidylyltransferase, partial [Melioribacteraceae bacterium]|nr:3-deoxy-manno-octulosonate cytidylyltransferase [Melioribacteraceae bacterium]
TDRVAFVAEGMNGDIFVNIQGDQPFVPSRMIDEAIEPFLFDKEVNISTVAKQITTVDELKSTSIPKVVFDYNNYALYFSRTAIPFVKEARTNLAKVQSTEVYKHIGVYVYRKSVLERLLSLKQTDLEKIEKLEQLRLLEHGFKVKIVVTDYECFSVHTPNDLEIARNYYKKIIKPKIVEE